MNERLLQAYFIDSADIGDPETLATCAAEVGLDRDPCAGVPRQRRRRRRGPRRDATGRCNGDRRGTHVRVRRQMAGAWRGGPRHVRGGLAESRRQAHRRCLIGGHCPESSVGGAPAGPSPGLRARLHADRELVETDRSAVRRVRLRGNRG